MKKRFFTAAAAVVLTALIFSACGGPGGTSGYSVNIATLTGGKITATPTGGIEGDAILLFVNPDAGYRLKAGTLKYDNTLISTNQSQPYQFYLPNSDVTVSAEFESLAELGLYSVTIGDLNYGKIIAEPQYGAAGTKITLIITPDKGYGIQDGTLKTEPALVIAADNTFTLLAFNVTVNAIFEKKDAAALLAVGKDALKAGNLDSAIDAFESSYSENDQDPEAIIYSSLGKLASIAKDAKTAKFMKDHLGFTGYPGTIGKLLSPDWMSDEYKYVEGFFEDGKWYSWYNKGDDFWDGGDVTESAYYAEVWNNSDSRWVYVKSNAAPKFVTEKMPGLDLPDWFAATETYGNTLVTGTKTTATWPLLLMANLLEKNPNGLNSALDDLISTVFSSNFDDAVSRIGNLSYEQSVKVDDAILEAFGVKEFLEGDIYIGKAEMEILLSAMRIVKASLEYVAAYDWNTDLTFLKTDWDKLTDDNIGNLQPRDLPFGNNFLKDRGNGSMGKSKSDFIKAIDDSVAAYNFLIGGTSKLPTGYKDTLNEYKFVKAGLTALRTAINDGGVFYVKEVSSGDTYDNTEAGALLGINMGKFFTAGQFAIDKLITTESSGRAPQFYGFNEGEDEVAINNAAEIDDYERIGIEVKLASVKEVLVYGLDEFFPVSSVDTFAIDMFPASVGKGLYTLYHK